VYKKLIILIAFISIKGYTQLDRNLFSFEYTLAPISNNGIDFSKTAIKLNIPTKLKKGKLFNSIGFNYSQLNYYDVNINDKDLEKFYGVNYGLTYMYPLSGKWKISTQGGISIVSNLTNSISSDDLLFRGGITAIKKGGTINKPSKFMFGLGYTTFSGMPRLLPIISYNKQVNEKLSYRIGFPNTFTKYKFNQQKSLKFGLRLNGFYANLSNPVNATVTETSNKASFRTVSLGLEYNYWMSDIWAIFFKGTYSFYNKYELLDNNNNTTYDFGLEPRPYFSTGIKLNLKNKFKNKKNDKQ